MIDALFSEKRCPTCSSPDPARHPAVQFEGEVHLCRDPWHKPTAQEIEAREARPSNEKLNRLRERFDSDKPFTRAHSSELLTEAFALSADLAKTQGEMDAVEQHVRILQAQRVAGETTKPQNDTERLNFLEETVMGEEWTFEQGRIGDSDYFRLITGAAEFEGTDLRSALDAGMTAHGLPVKTSVELYAEAMRKEEPGQAAADVSAGDGPGDGWKGESPWFKVGDRVLPRNALYRYYPVHTITEITERGFKYKHEPFSLGARIGVTDGGETFWPSEFELAADSRRAEP